MQHSKILFKNFLKIKQVMFIACHNLSRIAKTIYYNFCPLFQVMCPYNLKTILDHEI